MTRNRPINLDGRRCECGALTENGSPTCRKCRNRATVAPPQALAARRCLVTAAKAIQRSNPQRR